jgi:hypothetical protein
MKGCLEVGGNSKKPSSSEKDKKIIHGKFKCPNCQELGHRKKQPQVPPQWNQEKTIIKFVIPFCNTILNTLLTSFLVCRKQKPRKNTTKNWFSEEPSTSSPPPPNDDVAASPPPDDAASSPQPDAPHQNLMLPLQCLMLLPHKHLLLLPHHHLMYLLPHMSILLMMFPRRRQDNQKELCTS